jgi:hypothetical protein
MGVADLGVPIVLEKVVGVPVALSAREGVGVVGRTGECGNEDVGTPGDRTAEYDPVACCGGGERPLEVGATRRGVPEDGRARGDVVAVLEGSRVVAVTSPTAGLADCLGKTRDMAAAMAADVCIPPVLVAVMTASGSDHVVVEDEDDREKVDGDGEGGVLREGEVAAATTDAVSTGAVSSSSSSSSSLGDGGGMMAAAGAADGKMAEMLRRGTVWRDRPTTVNTVLGVVRGDGWALRGDGCAIRGDGWVTRGDACGKVAAALEEEDSPRLLPRAERGGPPDGDTATVESRWLPRGPPDGDTGTGGGGGGGGGDQGAVSLSLLVCCKTSILSTNCMLVLSNTVMRSRSSNTTPANFFIRMSASIKAWANARN